jgi:omega-hydroxy-beta-dihydromenaquinone-9 sulfotransferase
MKLFITGNSRSGTTMMSRILGNHEDVLAFQELHFFDELLPAGKAETLPSKVTAIKLFAKLCAIQRNGYFGSLDIRPFIAEAATIIESELPTSYMGVYEKFLVTEAAKHHKIIPCEQTPQNIFALEEILDHFPDVRIIIMVRDPREVLLSQKNKWKRRKLSGGKIPLLEAIRARINYHPVTISKIWKSVMQTALKFQNHPSVIFVKYEMLIRDPEKTIRDVCTHCGIVFSESMLDIPIVGSSNFGDNPQKRGIDTTKTRQWEKGGLNETEIAICQQINGTLMNQFGYDIRSVSPNMLLSAWYKISMPFRLGLALLFNLKRLRQVKKFAGRFLES